MESISLTSLADEKLTEARQAHSGRAAHTLHGGHTHELRQTLMALLAGHELSEHDSPGQASLQVLKGHVHLTAGDGVHEETRLATVGTQAETAVPPPGSDSTCSRPDRPAIRCRIATSPNPSPRCTYALSAQ